MFFVGEKFNEFLENFCLIFVDKCGYVLMMEYFDIFNCYLEFFLDEVMVKEVNN